MNNRYYVGSTNDLGRRLQEHNRGQTVSTRFGKQWRVVYSEQLPTRSDAIRRERQIKSYKGGNAFRQLIGNERE